MKYLIVLILVALIPSVYAWEDNFYFTVPPNGEKCFNFNIPKGFNAGSENRYQVNIFSDIPLNLNFIETDASTKNNIDVPICFSAKGRNESDFGYYTLLLKAKNREIVLKGGICVSNLDDVDIVNKQGEPCDLINSHNNLFSAGLTPNEITTNPGREEKIRLNLISSEDIDVEVKLETDLNIPDKSPNIVRLERGRIHQPIVFNFTAPKKGIYNFSVILTAIINREYCNFPFCKISLDKKIIVDGITKTGWDLSVFPPAHSVNRLELTEFLATVTNYEDDRDFTVDVNLPQGLRTDFKETGLTVKKNEQKNIIVKITPETLENKLYTITFGAKADREEFEQAYLNVGEFITDTCRKFPILCPSGNPPNLGGCTIKGTSLINTSCVVNTQPGNSNFNLTNGGGKNPTISPSEGINPFFIVIPIFIVALALIYFMFKRKSESDIEIE